MSADKRYPVAERFKAPQGEGQFVGTPMAFVRLVGCSVGKGVCLACDTDFDRVNVALGGGHYTAGELLAWAAPYRRVCLTGGEPLDRDVRGLLFAANADGATVHVETSGTKRPDWLQTVYTPGQRRGYHMVARDDGGDRQSWHEVALWLTVSPKPGYLDGMLQTADEVKVILGGLGDGPGWPTVDDACRWAMAGQLVFVQPRNAKTRVDRGAMAEALRVIDAHPELRLSMQAHKFLEVR